MSTTKPLDYGAWTRKNFPSLTETRQSLLSELLSEGRASRAFLKELEATPEQSLAAISEVLNSIVALWQAAGLLTAENFRGVRFAPMSRQMRERD